MKVSSVVGFLGLLPGAVLAGRESAPEMVARDANDVLAELQEQAIQALQALESNATEKRSASTCSIFNAQIRQDWEFMSADMRKSYVRAVQCLFRSPSKLTAQGWPTKSRYDDFVGVHINMTTTIHNTANFLGYHRNLVHAYETALRDECGYTGYAPYWNWFAHRENMNESPVFDGSDTSLGGDGEFFYHNGTLAGVLKIPIPSGNGGGCLKQGPFKCQTVHMGPLATVFDGFTKATSLFDENDHCIRRDINSYVSTNFMQTEHLVNLTLGTAAQSIKLFQEELQGGRYPGHLGLHAAGHFVMGGDGTDLFSSPNDPVFWLHHAMVDRVWWIWQALHPSLASSIYGTITMNDNPASRNGTLQDTLDTKGLGDSKTTLGDVMNTLGGSPLCYIYI